MQPLTFNPHFVPLQPRRIMRRGFFINKLFYVQIIFQQAVAGEPTKKEWKNLPPRRDANRQHFQSRGRFFHFLWSLELLFPSRPITEGMRLFS